jgi:4-hydroxybenzoate polyprenyltransferase
MVFVPPLAWSRLALYLDLIRWDRPVGTLLLLWPTLLALWLAARGFPGWHVLVVFVLGSFLMRSAGCVVNDLADRDFDRYVQRTADRPMARGAIQPKEALTLAALLVLLAFALVCTTSLVTVLWSVGALLAALIYPWTKRFLAMPQAVLGVAFGFGIPMAFAAVHGGVSLVSGLLFLSNLFWVLAYDTEYAMVDRDDDLRIGIRTSAITLGRWDVPFVMACYAMHLLLMGWVGHYMRLSWPFWVATLLAAVLAASHFRWIKERSREGCWRAFKANHWLGCVLWLGAVFALRS